MTQRAKRQPSVGDNVIIDVVREEPDAEEALDELRVGLAESPRSIPSKYFYDDRGSQLFEQITDLPEYYQTRTEKALLETIADRVIARSAAEELVELGSGAATKTRVLLDAMSRTGKLERYVPLDVSEGTVRRIAEELTAEYEGLLVHGIVGDFMKHLELLPDGGRRLVILLGGTIGNLDPESEAPAFLSSLASQMSPEDCFLLGVDLIKDVPTLEAAYNDAQGVTAEFNRNILRVVNRILAADFEPEAFAHRAFYNRQQDWIEMRLVAQIPQMIRLTALELEIPLAQGEEILTEISAKYDRPRVDGLFARSGFAMAEWYTDPDDLFALSLATKT